MNFQEFRTFNDEIIYINTEAVTALVENILHSKEKYTDIYVGKHAFTVKGEVDETLEALE